MFNGLTEDRVKSIDWIHPHYALPDGTVRYSVHAYVVESQGHRIIVDTCIGNDKPRNNDALPRAFEQGRLSAGVNRHLIRHSAKRRYMDAAPISRPEGGSRERSRLWKVGVVFAIALGFIMAMLDVTVVNVALADVQPRSGFPKAKIWNGYCGFSTLITQISKIAEFSSSMTKLISQASGSSARKIRKKNLAKFFGEYNSHSGITLIV